MNEKGTFEAVALQISKILKFSVHMPLLLSVASTDSLQQDTVMATAKQQVRCIYWNKQVLRDYRLNDYITIHHTAHKPVWITCQLLSSAYCQDNHLDGLQHISSLR